MPLALRVLFTLLLLAAVSLMALWLRDHPGMLRVDWLGWRIETPLAVALSAAAVAALTLALLIYGLVRLSHFPLRYRLRKQDARFHESLDELTYAMTSLAVADNAGALRHARLAEKHLGEHPLLELVRAHVARRNHDEAGARQQLQKMMEHSSTRMLAASALSRIAHREQRLDDALRLAETAYDMNPAHRPSLRALFCLYMEREAWEPALLLLEKARRQKHLGKAEAKHDEALLYWQQAAALTREGDAAGSALLIREAFRIEPGFVPAAHEHAARLIAAGHRRRAIAALRRAWRHQPHPLLTELFLDLHADAPPARLRKAVEGLTKTNPGHVESRLAHARAALMLTHWDDARNHLEAAMAECHQARLYRLLSEVERKAGNEAAAQRALEHASTASPDPFWVCGACQHPHDRWQLYCRACDSFDSLGWQPFSPSSRKTDDGFMIAFDMEPRPTGTA